MEDWVSVHATVNIPCGIPGKTDLANEKGLSYFSVQDQIVFHGFWPWSSEIFNALIVYDDKGNWEKTLPCPYSLSVAELNEMQVMIDTALSNAVTGGEKRVLKRAAERLTQVDGNALATSQEGCTDETDSHVSSKSRQTIDPWRSG